MTERRDHTATCHMPAEERAAALAALQDFVPVIIHATGEQARVLGAMVEECDCGRPERHFYVNVLVQNGDRCEQMGPFEEHELPEVLAGLGHHCEHVSRYTLPASLN